MASLTNLKDEVDTKQRCIEELERRRDMAKKEIKQLYARLQKKDQAHPEKEAKDEPSLMKVSGNQDLNVAGLLKLKIFKRDLAGFYKQIVNVVLQESIDKQEAVGLERKANELIMKVDDSINEVEIQVAAK